MPHPQAFMFSPVTSDKHRPEPSPFGRRGACLKVRRTGSNHRIHFITEDVLASAEPESKLKLNLCTVATGYVRGDLQEFSSLQTSGLNMWRLIFVCLLGLAWLEEANAETFLYKARCEGSSETVASPSDDLTKRPGVAIECDAVLVSRFKNGKVLIQVIDKASGMPLGFAGDALLQMQQASGFQVARVSLPNSLSPKSPHIFSADGQCAFVKPGNLSRIEKAGCFASVKVGSHMYGYAVNFVTLGAGEAVPDSQ